ncbi:hypothetical protein EOE67_01785 [Rheinheimera riviphila]|uniref:Uncharacterized protein n=1 Tax=Rheinheimera riviphila TaxID=1834037 RepID=A0A437R589_9GAMM|nr:hypothetical protein [Rheinheimera riviphila]RVU41946.1 hypothetical protein EOE67_01785 [Rheinheimera riviphila]
MRRPKLTLNEKLSLTMAAFALIVSIAAFYYQSLRSISQLTVTAVAPSIGPRSYVFEVAFFNSGNKAALIDRACVVTTTADPITNAGNCFVESLPQGLPAILQPGSILKIKLERTSVDWSEMYQTGLAASGAMGKRPGWKLIPIGLKLVVFDAEGIRHDATTEPLFSFHVHLNGSTSSPTSDYQAVAVNW